MLDSKAKCYAKFGERSLPPLRWANNCRRPLHLALPSGTQKSNLNSDGKHVSPSGHLWSQSAPQGSLKAALWSPTGIPNPQKPFENTQENTHFQKSTKSQLEAIIGHMLGTRGSPMGPMAAPRVAKGTQTPLIWNHFSHNFRHFSRSGAGWVHKGAQASQELLK